MVNKKTQLEAIFWKQEDIQSLQVAQRFKQSRTINMNGHGFIVFCYTSRRAKAASEWDEKGADAQRTRKHLMLVATASESQKE